MKQILFAFIFLSALYLAAFQLGKTHYFDRSTPAKISLPKTLDYGFHPTDYPLERRSFALVIVGYNNGAFVEKTLKSLFSQVYSNYRIIYVDDASTDGSFSLVKDLVDSSSAKDSVSLIRNSERLGELASLTQAIQGCADEEIVVWVGGQDWLAHEWVLHRLNAYYANPDLWLTFGQYREFPGYKLGMSAPFDRGEWEEKGARGAAFTAYHLKTFYAALLKQIDPADLMYQGSFLSSAIDMAVMIPLLELAQGHFQYIPEIIYIASQKAPEEPELFLRSQRYIRSLAAYTPLTSVVSIEAASE